MKFPCKYVEFVDVDSNRHTFNSESGVVYAEVSRHTMQFIRIECDYTEYLFPLARIRGGIEFGRLPQRGTVAASKKKGKA